MGYTRSGGFVSLNPIRTEQNGEVTVFPWPGKVASFYVVYQADSPALRPSGQGLRNRSKLINFWLRFRCGFGNVLYDAPVTANGQFIVLPMEIMEVAMSNGLGSGVEPPYDPARNWIEVRAPVGTNPAIWTWSVGYE